ncbi:HEAT repeat domain-containing protein [Granulicella sp. S190]|uniref:HEAT repeat domain-containing protein n=1 Tax=Granulicella sp. S190 TaxID=1747226 RepID=UPI00131D772E|nr:HEAT repeat domain-containing protein [Granulicella sp. S190]
MRTLARIFAASMAISAATVLMAQQPAILHAQLKTQTADHGLNAVLDGLKAQRGATWVGYSIPVKERVSSDWASNHVEYLEGSNGSSTNDSSKDDRKSFDHALILLKVADGGVTKLHVENPDRVLDAGGIPLVWLNGVDADDSARTLSALASQSDAEHLRDGAIFAISIHQTEAATAALVNLATSENDLQIREKAAFWLANQRGAEGFHAIQHLARTDGDERFREKLTFDLTLTSDPGGLTELIRMAHEDASPQVRKQAQFWMANKDGKKVAGDLREAASNDPDSGVRKSAVFALSQLPGEEAVTQLITVANSNGDPAVRKQAVFWLGQSNDPKALDYLTKLLNQ